MKNILLFIMFFVGVSYSGFSENMKNFSEVFDYSIDYSAVLPNEQNHEGFILIHNKPVSYNESISYNDISQEFVLKNKINSGSNYELILNKNLQLKKIAGSYNKTWKLKNFEINGIITEYSESGKYLSRKLYLDNKLVSEYKINCNNNTISFDACLVILQACLIKQIKGFKAEILFGSQTDKYSCEFKLVITRNFMEISPEYDNVPDYFRQKSVYANDVNVYVFKLTGAAGAFYKHKLYFAFDNTPLHKFLAYWGGDPKAAEYKINNK